MGPPDEGRATKTLEIYLPGVAVGRNTCYRKSLRSRAWLLTGDNSNLSPLLVRDKGKKN